MPRRKKVEPKTEPSELLKRPGKEDLAEFLLEVSNRVAMFPTLDEQLEALVGLTAQALGAERATLFLNDPATDELYSRIAQGTGRREIRILNNRGDRIDGCCIANAYVRQVACREKQRFVEGLVKDQHVVQLELLQFAGKQLRLRCLQLHRLDNNQAILADEFGQHRPQSRAVHFLVDLLVMAAGLSCKRAATAHPDRAADRSGACTARTLLSPRLGAATANCGAVLLCLGAGPRAREIRGDDLVDQPSSADCAFCSSRASASPLSITL